MTGLSLAYAVGYAAGKPSGKNTMPTFRTIALTTIALLALILAFASGSYNAKRETRDDRQDDMDSALIKRMDALEREVEKLQQRLGRGPGASQ
jgi:HAMP domain-containing protein